MLLELLVIPLLVLHLKLLLIVMLLRFERLYLAFKVLHARHLIGHSLFVLFDLLLVQDRGLN